MSTAVRTGWVTDTHTAQSNDVMSLFSVTLHLAKWKDLQTQGRSFNNNKEMPPNTNIKKSHSTPVAVCLMDSHFRKQSKVFRQL